MADDENGWIFPNGASKSGHVESMKKPFRRCVERAGLDPRKVIGAALALYFAGPMAPAVAGGAEPIRPASGSADSDTPSEHASKGSQVELIRMNPIIFQIPGPGGLRRSVGIKLALRLSSDSHRDDVLGKRPKLRARFFEAWASSPLNRTGEENFDPEEVRRRAQHASDRLYGEGVVVGILIEEISEVLIR